MPPRAPRWDTTDKPRWDIADKYSWSCLVADHYVTSTPDAWRSMMSQPTTPRTREMFKQVLAAIPGSVVHDVVLTPERCNDNNWSNLAGPTARDAIASGFAKVLESEPSHPFEQYVRDFFKHGNYHALKKDVNRHLKHKI